MLEAALEGLQRPSSLNEPAVLLSHFAKSQNSIYSLKAGCDNEFEGGLMRIAQLEISNFRGVETGHVNFDQHTVLVGANNAGKTTIIEALAVLFGRDKLVRNLNEYDFYGAIPEADSRFNISAILTDFSSNNPDDFPDWFRADRGVPKWFDPKDNTLHPEKINAECKLAVQIGVCGRFDHEDLEVKLKRYFVDDGLLDPFGEEFSEEIPHSLIREAGFFLVPASRTWDKMLSFGSELFRRVVSSAGSIPAQAIMKLRDEVREPESPLVKEEGLKSIFEDIDKELDALFPSPIKTNLLLTQTTSEAIMSNLVAHFSNGEDGVSVPASRQGSGVVSMQNLLLLLQLGKIRLAKGDNFFVAVEEPELHIPPSQQRRLTNRLKNCCQQTIVTTHSPSVASEFFAHNIRLITNDDGKLQARPFLEKELEANDNNPVRRLIQWQRGEAVNALMHERILIPEGKQDFNWLKKLCTGMEVYSKNADAYLFGSHIGIFPTDSSAVVQVVEVMAKAHDKIFCLVDGDAAGDGYIASLKALSVLPSRVLAWPKDEKIEDQIAKLLRVVPREALVQTNQWMATTYTDIEDVVALIKGKHKDDYLFHDVLLEVILSSDAGRAAVDKLMNEIMLAIKDVNESTDFAASPKSDANLEVLVYTK